MHPYTYVYIHAYIHEYMYICMYMCMHTYPHTHIYIYIYISELWGREFARTPRPEMVLACLLACTHARTHARTHAHSTVRSVWVCQLVRSVRLSVVRFFSSTCFLSVFEFACRYAVSFLRMSRGFRLVGDLESVGSRFARVFTRTLSVCVACSN